MVPLCIDFPKYASTVGLNNVQPVYGNPPVPNNDDSGGGILAIICGALCKDTPLAEAFGVSNNNNNDNVGVSNMVQTTAPATGEIVFFLLI